MIAAKPVEHLAPSRPWLELLFVPDLPETQVSYFDLDGIKDIKSFRQKAPAPLAQEDLSWLCPWYESSEGQANLLVLLDGILDAALPYAKTALPVHDARHALFKTPLSVISHLFEKDFSSIHRLAVIAALCHDLGHWAEELMCGHPKDGGRHARFSFLIMLDLLTRYGSELPVRAKELLLYCVLQHQCGGMKDDGILTQLVVSADIEQALGPEGILRLIHKCETPTCHVPFWSTDYRSPSLAFHLHDSSIRFARSGMLMRAPIVRELRQITTEFILRLEPKELSWARFNAAGWNRNLWVSKRTFPGMASNALSLLDQFLATPLISPVERYKAACQQRLSSCPPEVLPYVAGALQYACVEMAKSAEEDAQKMAGVYRTVFATDSFMTAVLERLEMLPALVEAGSVCNDTAPVRAVVG